MGWRCLASNEFSNLIAIASNLITVIGIGAGFLVYWYKQLLERKDRLYQEKLNKYDIFMRSLPGICEEHPSLTPHQIMRKDFILNFYRIHLSCSAQDINKISNLLEAIKVGSPNPMTDEQKDTQIVEIINFFRRDLGLDKIDKFNHYGW